MITLVDSAGRVRWDRVKTDDDLMTVGQKIGIGDGRFGHPDLYRFICQLLDRLSSGPEQASLRLLTAVTLQRLRALETLWNTGAIADLHTALGWKRPTKRAVAAASKGFDAYAAVERERLKGRGDIHAALEAAAKRLNTSPGSLSRIYYDYRKRRNLGDAMEVTTNHVGKPVRVIVASTFSKSKRKVRKTS